MNQKNSSKPSQGTFFFSKRFSREQLKPVRNWSRSLKILEVEQNVTDKWNELYIQLCTETFIVAKEIVFILRVFYSVSSLLCMALDSWSEVFVLFLTLQIQIFNFLMFCRSQESFQEVSVLCSFWGLWGMIMFNLWPSPTDSRGLGRKCPEHLRNLGFR